MRRYQWPVFAFVGDGERNLKTLFLMSPPLGVPVEKKMKESNEVEFEGALTQLEAWGNLIQPKPTSQ